MDEHVSSLHGAHQPFMEWRCDKSGTWVDESGEQASEREASLLDSILLLTDEKRRLADAIKLLTANILGIESAAQDLLGTDVGNSVIGSTFRAAYPELTGEILRVVRVSKLIGEMNEL